VDWDGRIREESEDPDGEMSGSKCFPCSVGGVEEESA
jgi:hypothetical protein